VDYTKLTTSYLCACFALLSFGLLCMLASLCLLASSDAVACRACLKFCVMSVMSLMTRFCMRVFMHACFRNNRYTASVLREITVMFQEIAYVEMVSCEASIGCIVYSRYSVIRNCHHE
jgi:hypothetical protein